MARAIAAGVAVGAAIAACFSTPPRPGISDDGAVTGDVIRTGDDARDDDAGVIDSSEADAMTGCTSELFLQSGLGCGPGFTGSGFGSAATGRTASQLHLAMTGTAAGSASCRMTAMSINSVTFDIADVLATPDGDSTFVGFIAGNGSAYGVQILYAPADSRIDIEPICPGFATFPLPAWDPTQHFVRLTRNTGGGTTDITIGSTPGGGDVVYQCTGTAQFNTAAITAIQSRSGAGGTGSARIETIEYCP